MSPLLYADHAATTPCDPAVAELVMKVLVDDWGNPSSRQYALGRSARGRVDTAREQLAAALGAHHADEVVFTSGATEACNLAVSGVMARSLRQRPRLVVLATEHPAVLASGRACAAAGADLVIVPVDQEGRVDPAALAAAIDDRTALVCCMLVNNESGVVQDVAAAAALAHAHGALLFCDATQALGRMPLDVTGLGCDLLACTAHKAYGAKGAGALWLRRGLGPEPLLHGGGQERNLRAGTENVPAIAGFGLAAQLSRERLADTAAHLSALTASLESRLRAADPGIVIHGAGAPRVPGTTFFTRPGLPRGLLAQLDGIAASAGSSCASGSGKSSHVLAAMGVPAEQAAGAVRISFGRGNAHGDGDRIAAAVQAGAQRLAHS